MCMAHVYIKKKCLVTKASWNISSFPDVQYVKNAQKNYNKTYGVNPDYYPAPYKGHKGTDYLTPSGTAVYGIDGCTVVSINAQGTGLGNHIEFGNERIVFTVAHLSKINVKKGQVIDSSKVIGYTGNTGLSQGPHLHVHTWFGDVLDFVDSTPYMAGDYAIPFPGDASEKLYPHIECDVGYGVNGETITGIRPQYGRYHFTKAVNHPIYYTLSDAFTKTNVQAHYVKGESVNYKRIVDTNIWRYIVYVSVSGKTCYIPVRNLVTGWTAGNAT